jgi:predicted nucleotidyltransferase
MDKDIMVAKKIINEELKKSGFSVDRIILFGSRAKGTYKKDSDWDFLIIIKETITFPELRDIIADIQIRLAEKRIPNDIIIRGESDFEKMKNVIGNISYFANREGMPV